MYIEKKILKEKDSTSLKGHSNVIWKFCYPISIWSVSMCILGVPINRVLSERIDLNLLFMSVIYPPSVSSVYYKKKSDRSTENTHWSVLYNKYYVNLYLSNPQQIYPLR